MGFAVSSGQMVDVLVVRSERTEMCAISTEQPAPALLVKKTLCLKRLICMHSSSDGNSIRKTSI